MYILPLSDLDLCRLEAVPATHLHILAAAAIHLRCSVDQRTLGARTVVTTARVVSEITVVVIANTEHHRLLDTAAQRPAHLGGLQTRVAAYIVVRHVARLGASQSRNVTCNP